MFSGYGTTGSWRYSQYISFQLSSRNIDILWHNAELKRWPAYPWFLYFVSHHCDVICIYLPQNLFPPGKYSRTISLILILILINIMTFHKSHRRLHRNVQHKIKVVPIPSYVLVRTTQSKGVIERGPKLPKHSKFNQFLPSLCTCFKSTGRQRKDLITHANKGQIESTSEVALNRPKGNIINLSSWSHTSQSQSSSI